MNSLENAGPTIMVLGFGIIGLKSIEREMKESNSYFIRLATRPPVAQAIQHKETFRSIDGTEWPNQAMKEAAEYQPPPPLPSES